MWRYTHWRSWLLEVWGTVCRDSLVSTVCSTSLQWRHRNENTLHRNTEIRESYRCTGLQYGLQYRQRDGFAKRKIKGTLPNLWHGWWEIPALWMWHLDKKWQTKVLCSCMIKKYNMHLIIAPTWLRGGPKNIHI